MMRLLITATQLTVLGVTLLSVAGFFGAWHTYLDWTAHFKPHYLVLALLGLLAALSLHLWPWAAAALGAFALNLAVLVPCYVPPPSPAPPRVSVPLKVLCANVQYTNTRYAAFLAVIRAERPHVVIAQEASAPWLAALDGLRAEFPYAITIPRRGGAGLGCYSRLPLEHAEVLALGQPPRPGLLTHLRLDGAVVALCTIHPRPPLRRHGVGPRNTQLQAAAALLHTLPSPKLLIGDLNTSPWSPAYRRVVQTTGLRDARRGFGLWPTWPADWPWLAVPIDHCLVSPELTVVHVRTGPAIGSDHLPLIVELQVPVSHGSSR
jgi:endonuclease/exonuclease/phosphatase (EEP) superfamily protein YafD